MISHLVDGDYASNHLSWQWVAGSYTGSAYLPQQDNINEYTRTLQKNTYLDTTYETIADMPIPDVLSPLTATAEVPRPLPTLPESDISLDDALKTPEILLYSPWTLDPNWHRDSSALRLLMLPPAQFASGVFGQHVVDSIISAARLLPNIRILTASPNDLKTYNGSLTRKEYAGIRDWPGSVQPAELLHPDVPDKLYNSFSAYWKQVHKTASA